ncbi:MAG: hypothetical protein WA510_27075, partial [Acidobacteriaceae bacterium]
MKKTALSGLVAVLALEASCMMGPKYKRPSVDVPQEYRAPAPQQAAQTSSLDDKQQGDKQQGNQQLGNEQWWQV